jgi:hypothetical protein
MTPVNYSFDVQGHWFGPRDEKPAVTGAKFVKTLDLLSRIDPLLSDWQVIRNLEIAEDEQPRQLPLASVRNRIAAIVESGVSTDDFGQPEPASGYFAIATAGARGARYVTLTIWTGDQTFTLSFGEYNIETDLSIIKYPLFKAALLAMSAVWDAQWAYARACRSEAIKVPIDFGGGVPAFRIDTAMQVPLDPMFPKSVFHVPWIIYLSAQQAAGVTFTPEILAERTSDDGLVMSATTDQLDPTNPAHARRARILAETMIALTGSKWGGDATGI